METLTLRANKKDLEERITLQNGELIIQKNIVNNHRPTEAKLDNKKLKELKETATDLAYHIGCDEGHTSKKLRAYYDTLMRGAPMIYIEPYYKKDKIYVLPFEHKTIEMQTITPKGIVLGYKDFREEVICINFEARYELAEELQSANVG